jgi:hypothetical protein
MIWLFRVRVHAEFVLLGSPLVLSEDPYNRCVTNHVPKVQPSGWTIHEHEFRVDADAKPLVFTF